MSDQDAVRYTHISSVVGQVHNQLVGWTRNSLRLAGLETVEVYGQFPADGTTATYVVLFPYRLGPAPKIVETSNGINLLGPKQPIPDKGSFVPRDWAELGRCLSEAMRLSFPIINAKRGYPRPHPAPTIDLLPKPLQKWYSKQDPDAEMNWVARRGDGLLARLPSMWWKPSFSMTIHYMAVANDGGRGTSQRTSMDAPIALPALSVIASGLHLQRNIKVTLPPLPVAPEIWGMSKAFGESVGGELGDKILGLIDTLQSDDHMTVQVVPVHDLTNMDFANLMQALQRPLQPALNLAVRLPLGGFVEISPSVSPNIGTDNARRNVKQAPATYNAAGAEGSS